MNPKRLAMLCAAMTLFSLGGCAYVAGGAAGVYFLLQEDDTPVPLPPDDILPNVSVTTPAGNHTGAVTIAYTLFDANDDPADVTVEFTTDLSTYYTALMLTGSEGTTGLEAASGGTLHSFEWDASNDPNVTGYNVSVQVRITPSDSAGNPGTADTTSAFTVQYNAEPVVSVSTPSGVQKMDVPILYSLTDGEGDAASVLVEYSTTSAVASFAATTAGPGGDGTAGLVTSTAPPGPTYTFVWDSLADLGFINSPVWIRVTPTDDVTALSGAAQVIGPFQVTDDIMEIVISTGEGDLSWPFGVDLDALGNVYIADTFRSQIRVLNLGTSTITVFGVSIDPNELGVVAGTGIPGFNGDDQPAIQAQLNWPYDLAVDQASGDLYICDSRNHRIRRIDASTAYITTVAGDGLPGIADNVVATQGNLREPRGIALDTDTPPNIYVADTDNHALRCINRGSANLYACNTIVYPAQIALFSGTLGSSGSNDGVLASSATWNAPWGIALDASKHIYVSDSGNNWIRFLNNNAGVGVNIGGVTIPDQSVDRIAGPSGTAPGYAGDGGSAVGASVLLNRPAGLCLTLGGHVLFADSNNHCIRAVNVNQAAGGTLIIGDITVTEEYIDTVAGNGTAGSDDDIPATVSLSGILQTPRGLAVDSAGNLLVTDSLNNLLRCVNADPSNPITMAGVTVAQSRIRAVKGSAGVQAVPNPRGLALYGNLLYAVDALNSRIVSYDLTTGALAVVAGSGTPGFNDNCALLLAQFNSPNDIAVSSTGSFLLVSDRANDCIRLLNISGAALGAYGIASVSAGQITTISSGTLSAPCGIALQGDNTLFVADRARHRIARIDYSTGAVTTVAGTINIPGFTGDGAAATSAHLSLPEGVAVDAAGNLYITDTGNHAVRVVCRNGASLSFGTLSIADLDIDRLAGDAGPIPSSGYNGDNINGTTADLDTPTDVFVDGSGDVYFCDRNNHRIRCLDHVSGNISTVAGTGTAGFNQNGLPPDNSHLNRPNGLALYSGIIYVSDSGNSIVRRFTK